MSDLKGPGGLGETSWARAVVIALLTFAGVAAFVAVCASPNPW